MLSTFADVASIVTALAVVIAVLSFIGDKSQRHREFESLYVQRYWAIHDRQSPAVRLGSSVGVDETDRALALDYLRLCEDEIEIRSLGLVTNRTWRVWSAAIAAGIATPLSEQLRGERPSELLHVRRFAAERRDPYRGWKLWGKWNGL